MILDNILSPPILFFFLGILAVMLKSDLEIPQPIPKFLSLYLLFAIGFKGGVELSREVNADILISLSAAMVMASVVPLYSFFVLKRKLKIPDAAAIAATYGSISAVTFITAVSFLEVQQIGFGGHLVAAMALMESPAIIIGVMLHRLYSKEGNGEKIQWEKLLRDAFLNGSVFLILGSLVIGFITGESGHKSLEPFTDTIFKGMLALFLLDMGLIAAKRLNALKKAGMFLIVFSILMPVVNGLISIAIGYLLKFTIGDAFLFTILCASASYIAVPAAVRLTIPEANPSLYVPMSLGITFPFNIIVGLPAYLYIIQSIWN